MNRFHNKSGFMNLTGPRLHELNLFTLTAQFSKSVHVENVGALTIGLDKLIAPGWWEGVSYEVPSLAFILQRSYR